MSDTPSYRYHEESKKVYLMNVVNGGNVHGQDVSLSSLDGVPRRKRIALVPTSRLQTLQSVQLPNNRNSPVMTSESIDDHQLANDELVLDDGVQESTIIIDYPHSYSDPDMIEIDQHGSPIPILEADSPGISTMLIGGHQQMVSGNILGRRSPIEYEQHTDPQYNDDIRFQALIASKLAELDEPNKAIMKLHIQRILFEARFGENTSTKLIPNVE